MGRTRTQLLEVLDAAYDLEANAGTWMTGVCSAAARAFPNATGALAYRYKVVQGAPSLTSDVVGNVEYLDVPEEGHESVSAASVMRAYVAPSHAEPTTVFHADPRSGRVPEALMRMWAKHDVIDMFGVYATRPGEENMTIGIGMPRISYPEVRAQGIEQLSRDWTNIARHLEHAQRIRDTIAVDCIAAEFDVHGAGDFSKRAEPHRDELLALAKRTEHARTEMMHNGLAVWDQLLCGRWSIVRLQRTSGRLRFLALENPRSDDLRVLTPIERAVIDRVASGQSNKVIAMDLELHLSSVGNITARAMRKLGIDRRVHVAALARLLAGLQPPMPHLARASAAANYAAITP